MSNYEYTRMRLDGGWKLDKTFIVALLDELDRLQQASRWIPVSERLPDGCESVIGWDGEELAVIWWDSEGGIHHPNYTIDSFVPTHWQPLPTPPEGE